MTRELIESAVRDPDATLRRVERLLATTGLDAGSRAGAWHAAARARFERGEPDLAVRAARRALAGAERAADAAHVAELRLLLAWIEQDRGNPKVSVAQLDLAQPRLRGALLARARCLRGLNLCVTGGYGDAQRELSTAIVGLRRHGDTHWLANALNGRGVVRGYLLRLGAAEEDLAAAAALFTELGEPERAAACLHNRGFVALQAGDIPRALALFDRAAETGLRVSGRAEALVDRACALLGAGLVTDAAEALELAWRLLDGAGRGMRFADAALALGQCALRAGRRDLALDAVRRARGLFRAQRRAAWSAAADSLEIRVRLTTGARPEAPTPSALRAAGADAHPPPAVVGAARRAALRCVRYGWRVEAAELRLDAALVADRTAARHLLGLVQAERGAGPARLRALGWLARARLAGLAGDHDGVLAACLAGLRVADSYASVMGALELQAGAAELAGELASTGLAAAVATSSPTAVLRWTEWYRAAVLRVAPVRPPRDPAVAAGLVELRAAEEELRGGADRAQLRRLEELEGRVRGLSLAAAGSSGAGPNRVGLRVGELAERLGGAALLSFLVHDGELAAAVVVDGRVLLHRIADAARVFADVDALRFAVGLHACTGRDRAEVAAREAARRLDRVLLGPLRTVVADRPLVVVPTSGLHGLPWAALESCAGRPVSVAPSASAWLRAACTPEVAASPVWVAGPGLRHADREAAGLHRRYAGVLLASEMSTVESVLTAMDGAGLVHIAAHGRFREDAPMFSCLELADGPLYGYDLDRLTRAPRWLVLSACEGALSAVRPCDELIGLATVLLRRGTSALVASTVPVPDEAAVDLVTSLHAHLRSGAGPAAALASAQAEHGHLGFVCLGAG